MACRLCKMSRRGSKWHYYDDQVIVCHCAPCGQTMVVLRRHTVLPSVGDLMAMWMGIEEAGFLDMNIRLEQTHCPGHLHWHLIHPGAARCTSTGLSSSAPWTATPSKSISTSDAGRGSGG